MVAVVAKGDCRQRMASVTPKENGLAGGRRNCGEMVGSWANQNKHSGMMMTAALGCTTSQRRIRVDEQGIIDGGSQPVNVVADRRNYDHTLVIDPAHLTSSPHHTRLGRILLELVPQVGQHKPQV